MKRPTSLAETIDAVADKPRLDSSAKKLLALRQLTPGFSNVV